MSQQKAMKIKHACTVVTSKKELVSFVFAMILLFID
jgi:hypothetical protein